MECSLEMIVEMLHRIEDKLDRRISELEDKIEDLEIQVERRYGFLKGAVAVISSLVLICTPILTRFIA